jgi:hypothetical protein
MTIKAALELFAQVSWDIEQEAHRDFINWDRLSNLKAIAHAAADLVEAISGNRPEFKDLWGFNKSVYDGGIVFRYSGLDFEYDGKTLTLA